jgi:HAD superfamily hydrolase (TIGR01509 family)
MAFKRVVFEFHCFYGRNYRLDPERHDSHHREEAVKTLYFLKRYGIATTIVSSVYTLINGVDFSGIMEFLAETPRFVRDKEVFLREMLRRSGVSPYEFLYVDDIAYGIEQAKRVGVQTCGLTPGLRDAADVREARPFWLADSLSYVAAIAAAQLPQY